MQIVGLVLNWLFLPRIIPWLPLQMMMQLPESDRILSFRRTNYQKPLHRSLRHRKTFEVALTNSLLHLKPTTLRRMVTWLPAEMMTSWAVPTAWSRSWTRCRGRSHSRRTRVPTWCWTALIINITSSSSSSIAARIRNRVPLAPEVVLLPQQLALPVTKIVDVTAPPSCRPRRRRNVSTTTTTLSTPIKKINWLTF